MSSVLVHSHDLKGLLLNGVTSAKIVWVKNLCLVGSCLALCRKCSSHSSVLPVSDLPGWEILVRAFLPRGASIMTPGILKLIRGGRL